MPFPAHLWRKRPPRLSIFTRTWSHLTRLVCSFLSTRYLSHFSHLVPIYDGRARHGQGAFDFSDTAFSNLSKLPMYTDSNGERVDLPSDAISVVGYTTGTYYNSNKNCRCISPNLLFIILLAIPSVSAWFTYHLDCSVLQPADLVIVVVLNNLQ